MKLRFAPFIAAAFLVCQSACAAPAPWGPPPSAERNVANQAATWLAGNYSVEGMNPNGTPYRGLCIIEARSDGRYDFRWHVGAFHRGVGTVNGNTVTVEFGDVTPAIFEIRSDGSLVGTWANGAASETLTPVAQLRAGLSRF